MEPWVTVSLIGGQSCRWIRDSLTDWQSLCVCMCVLMWRGQAVSRVTGGTLRLSSVCRAKGVYLKDTTSLSWIIQQRFAPPPTTHQDQLEEELAWPMGLQYSVCISVCVCSWEGEQAWTSSSSSSSSDSVFVCAENVGQPLILPPSAIPLASYLFLCLSLFLLCAAVAAVATVTADIGATAPLPYLPRLILSLSPSRLTSRIYRGVM